MTAEFTTKQHAVLEVLSDQQSLMADRAFAAGGSVPIDNIIAGLIGEHGGNRKSWRTIMQRMAIKGLPIGLDSSSGEDRLAWSAEGARIMMELNGSLPEPEPEPINEDEVAAGFLEETDDLVDELVGPAPKSEFTTKQTQALRAVAYAWRQIGSPTADAYTTEIPTDQVYGYLVDAHGATPRSWSSVIASLAKKGICHTDDSSRFIIVDNEEVIEKY